MKQRIDLKLFATLSRFQPSDSANFSIEPDETACSLIRRLGIPVQEAKLIFINGIKGDENAPLKNGDRVGIFPPVGGG